ncbi:cytochrome ubiquinol oxidase subunit I, partial [Klebsiella pneumoniae]
VYSAVFGVGYIYMMQLIKKGPQTGEGQYLQEGGPGKLRTPARFRCHPIQALPS